MNIYGGETGNRLQPAAGLQEFGVRYILSSSSKSSHASCRENFIPEFPYFRGGLPTHSITWVRDKWHSAEQFETNMLAAKKNENRP